MLKFCRIPDQLLIVGHGAGADQDQRRAVGISSPDISTKRQVDFQSP